MPPQKNYTDEHHINQWAYSLFNYRCVEVVPYSKKLASNKSFPTIKTAPSQCLTQSNPRYKTKMCANGINCQHGETCIFAHSREELRTPDAYSLHQSGVVNLNTYRQTPCFTHITTGACPYKDSCKCIHDPRFDNPNIQAPLKLMRRYEFKKNEVYNHLCVDGNHELLNEEIQGASLFDLRAGEDAQQVSERIYHRVTNSGPSSTNGSSIPHWVKVKIALEFRRQPNGELSLYKSNAKLEQSVNCMIGSRKLYDQNSREFLVMNTRRFAYNERTGNIQDVCISDHTELLARSVDVLEVSFGPTNGSDLLNRILLFNPPMHCLQFMKDGKDRFNSKTDLNVMLSKYEIFSVVNVNGSEEECLVQNVLESYIDNDDYRSCHQELQSKLVNYIDRKHEWRCPHLRNIPLQDFKGLPEPLVRVEYSPTSILGHHDNKARKYGFGCIWDHATNDVKPSKNYEGFRYSRLHRYLSEDVQYSIARMLDTEEEVKTDYDDDCHNDYKEQFSRSEICWRSLLLKDSLAGWGSFEL